MEVLSAVASQFFAGWEAIKQQTQMRDYLTHFLRGLRDHLAHFLLEFVRLAKSIGDAWPIMSTLVRQELVKALIFHIDALALRFSVTLLDVDNAVEASSKNEESRLYLVRYRLILYFRRKCSDSSIFSRIVTSPN